MRKVVTVIAISAALTAATVMPASAHSGTAGPFSTIAKCNEARKKYANDGHKVSECFKTEKGLFFKFADA
jgi:hypothetical protein